MLKNRYNPSNYWGFRIWLVDSNQPFGGTCYIRLTMKTWFLAESIGLTNSLLKTNKSISYIFLYFNNCFNFLNKKTLQCKVLNWWKRVDSNHRSHGRQIYSLVPLAARELFLKNGAGDRNRTYNLLITSQLLYRWATPA